MPVEPDQDVKSPDKEMTTTDIKPPLKPLKEMMTEIKPPLKPQKTLASNPKQRELSLTNFSFLKVNTLNLHKNIKGILKNNGYFFVSDVMKHFKVSFEEPPANPTGKSILKSN